MNLYKCHESYKMLPSAPHLKVKGCVHNSSIANPLKIVNNWFCSHLFSCLLKFRGHIGKLASCGDRPSEEQPQDIVVFNNDKKKARGQPALAKRRRGLFPVALIDLFSFTRVLRRCDDCTILWAISLACLAPAKLSRFHLGS